MAIKLKLSSPKNSSTSKSPLAQTSNPIGGPVSKEELEKLAAEKLRVEKEVADQKRIAAHNIEEEQRLETRKREQSTQLDAKKEKEHALIGSIIDQQTQRLQQREQQQKSEAEATAAAIKAKEKDILDGTVLIDDLTRQLEEETVIIEHIEATVHEQTMLVSEKEAEVALWQEQVREANLAYEAALQDFDDSKFDLNQSINTQAKAWGLVGSAQPTEAFSQEKMVQFSNELGAMIQMQTITIEKYETQVAQANDNWLTAAEKVAYLKENQGTPEEINDALVQQDAAMVSLNRAKIPLALETRNRSKNQQIFDALQTKISLFTEAENNLSTRTTDQSSAQSSLNHAVSDHGAACESLNASKTNLEERRQALIQIQHNIQETQSRLHQAKEELRELNLGGSNSAGGQKKSPAMTRSTNTSHTVVVTAQPTNQQNTVLSPESQEGVSSKRL